MSLTGSLEDIALGELLQIVGLSRKNGFINVTSRGREGRIVFSHGLVTEATSSTFRQSFGELLIKKGIVNLPQMRQALAVQEAEGKGELIGKVLSRIFDVPGETVEEVGREQVQNVVHSLFEWAEGTFEFHVDEDPAENPGDHLTVTLSDGLDPDLLAVDGARIAEEKMVAALTPQSAPEIQPPLVPPRAIDAAVVTVPARSALPEYAHGKALPPIIIVDDDVVTKRLLAEAVERAGYAVRSFTKAEDALTAIDSLCRAGELPVVVTDLIMPRMDGSGILGGLELLEFLKGNYPRVKALALCDYHSDDAERKVLEMGYVFLPKPGKTEISSSIIPFSEKLLRLLNSGGSGDEGDAASVNLADELRLELGESEGKHGAPKTSAGVSLLRGMLQELHDPDLGHGVILLVLRFASEFMNRAVLLLVNEQTITGVGQFGIAGKDADSRVRNLVVPVDEKSMFDRLLDAKISMNITPERTASNERILGQLGGLWPKEIFLGPILSEGRVVAILYGDNLPEKKAVGETESLEIFLSQAGSAMERALVPLDGEREDTAYGVDR